MEKITITENYKYLSEFLRGIPSNCLINKGITGCGGTTVELKSERDSIVLCPTKNLVTSKSNDRYLGVTGDTKSSDIKDYIKSDIKYKKIIATYDSLKRLMEIIPNYRDYFLLIDEYHLLFNDYSFRSDAILYLLNNFREFKEWAFLTATPLKDEFILKELKDIPQITYEWENAIPVHINIKDTYFIQKELFNLIDIYKDRNLHIFLNSVSTIYKITEKLNTDSFRVVCSENSKTKIKNFSKINSPIAKYNFYTSCSFEGCLLPEEKVLTDSGLKNAKDIVLEDKLINKDGNLVSIINLQQYDKFNEDVYTLKLSNTYRTTTFTKIHPILISKHPLKEEFTFKQCQNINKGEWTVYPNLYRKEIEIDSNDWNKFMSKSNKDIINPILNEDFWWFIGLYLGDGWTQNDGYRIFISVNKNETITINRLESFCKRINRSYIVKERSKNCLEYIINCKQLVDFLNSNFGKYANGKYIPEKYKYIPHNLKIALINGYFDSDGCIMFSNTYKGTFVSINLKLLEDFQDIFTSLGLKTNLKLLRRAKKMKIENREVNCSETYDLNISHNDLIKFYDMCNDKNFQKLSLIHLDKSLRNKRNPRFVGMDFSDDMNYVYFKIKEINTFKYTGKVYNYECDTHTYVCRHMTTHNCDILDPDGYCIIISDTNIATTVLDISTKVRQVCGRLRDSKYKDEVTLILNTSKHRYAGTTREDFNKYVEESERLGKVKANVISKFSEDEMKAELRTYNKESYSNIYLNKYDNNIFYDENLKFLDLYNYDLISEIYNNSISVIGECSKNNLIPKKESALNKKGLTWINEKLNELNRNEYTYNELEEIFTPLFKEHNMKWSHRVSVNTLFPPHNKVRKTINRVRNTYYIFK